jgi:hypothetical protein
MLMEVKEKYVFGPEGGEGGEEEAREAREAAA